MVAGSTQSGIYGNRDGVVLKYSLSGTLINDNFYGGVQEDKLVSIVESSNSKFSMMGYTYSWGWGNGTPDFIWYDQNSAGGNYGGNKSEKGYCISTTSDGGFIICGYSSSYTTLDHIYLIKTDSNHVSSANVVVVPTTDPLSVNEGNQSTSNFYFYPNPVNNYLNINLTSQTKNNSTILITDIIGRILITEKNNNQNIKLNTTNIPNGLYLLSIINEDSITTKKILIQH
jgi:hypothetical protein